ncbi:hypothetical protein [Candidatus Poriferisodalis sp.]|uniref:hypothetical protein n=1 Tax=Candidatus Poriferisodalis sp. TaxID=3101277 RepID=UPI003B02A50D
MSSQGQISLPAATRHRRGLNEGGDITHLDLGGVLLPMPGNIGHLRAELLDTVTRGISTDATASLGILNWPSRITRGRPPPDCRIRPRTANGCHENPGRRLMHPS